MGPFGSFIEYAMLNDAVSQLHAKFIDTPDSIFNEVIVRAAAFFGTTCRLSERKGYIDGAGSFRYLPPGTWASHHFLFWRKA